MPRTELRKIPKTETKDGVPYQHDVLVEHLTQDEVDRSLIRRGMKDTRYATKLPDYMSALSRAGEITEADFPFVVGINRKGEEVDGLDMDDAFMAGQRPEWLSPDQSTAAEMARWLIEKIESPSPYSDDKSSKEQEIIDRFKSLKGAIGDIQRKFQTASNDIHDDAMKKLKYGEYGEFRGSSEVRRLLDGFHIGSAETEDVRSWMLDALDELGAATVADIKELLRSF